MATKVKKVFFSNHWESEGLDPLWSPERFTPKGEGKWKSLEICFDIDEADIIVINDAPRVEDGPHIDGMDNTKFELWWFVREPWMVSSILANWNGEVEKHLSPFPNVRFFNYSMHNIPLLGTWHLSEDYDYYKNLAPQEKTKRISAVFSDKSLNIVGGAKVAKTMLAERHREIFSKDIPSDFIMGYDLRSSLGGYLVYGPYKDIFSDIDLYGRICNVPDLVEHPLKQAKGAFLPEDKFKAFRDYDYSIVIENSSIKNYFTEKLFDCFLERTVPLYWGCPNILDYFPEESLIVLTTEDLSSPQRMAEIVKNLKKPNETTMKAVEEARRLILDEHNMWELLHQINEGKR